MNCKTAIILQFFSTIPVHSRVKLTVVCLSSRHVCQLVNLVCQNLSNHLLDVALGKKSQLIYKDYGHILRQSKKKSDGNPSIFCSL